VNSIESLLRHPELFGRCHSEPEICLRPSCGCDNNERIEQRGTDHPPFHDWLLLPACWLIKLYRLLVARNAHSFMLRSAPLRGIARAALGHLERFPPEMLSGRCRIGQETSAGAYSGDGLAPLNEPARAGGSTGRGRRIFGEVMCGSA